jgi:exodeoxyribonuclease VII small subunit
MADVEYTFAQARARLEDIVGQVRKKDLSLEKSLDLLEEGVRLANACTEHIDHSEWRTVAEEIQAGEVDPDIPGMTGSDPADLGTSEVEDAALEADDAEEPTPDGEQAS